MNRLDRLLRPKSIAVVGGGFFGTNVVGQSLKMGFAGEIWPVHPTKDEIAGVRAYRSVAELPAAPDAVFVGVNRHATIGIVRELGERGAGGAVCFASGFLEAGDGEGAGLQEELVAAAGEMPIIGPNCYGLINYADGALLWPDQHGGRRLNEGERGVAIITQSSNIAINMTMQRRGLPVAYIMTAGNQAQTGLSEMAIGLIEDSRVSALGLHIEGFDSVAGFERLAARARELKKPIVAIKVGRSEAARAAAVTHTASLTGSDAASTAFLKRLGIARVGSVPAFLETLKLLHVTGPLAGFRLSSMSCSGGEASLVADSAEGRRVYFPALQEAHRAKVKEALGPLVAVANPLDYHTFIWNDEPAMRRAFSAMVSGGFDLNMLVLDFPRSDRCSDADWWPTIRAFTQALEENAARGAVVASLPENMPEKHAAALIEQKIAPLAGIDEALEAIEAAAVIGTAWQRPFALPLPGTPSSLPPSGGEVARRSRGGERVNGRQQPHAIALPTRGSEGASGNRRTLNEAEAKVRLAAAGLPVPPGRRVETAEEAVAAALGLGFPVALKALGLDHKSEHNALRLDLREAGAVRLEAQALQRLGNGMLVERMVEAPVAELIVGIARDPVFGPVMAVGSGGVLVELFRDTATLLLPAGREEIEAALCGLKLFPLLGGYRGRPKADIAAAVEAIAGIAAFAAENADRLEELDVNPLIVSEEGRGAWIADALMVVREGKAARAAETGAAQVVPK